MLFRDKEERDPFVGDDPQKPQGLRKVPIL